MALALLQIHKRAKELRPREFIHVAELLTTRLPCAASRGGDWAKLAYWGLIEEQAKKGKDGNPRAGFWRITGVGVSFIRGELQVPRYAYLYDGKLQKMSAEMTTFKAALKDPFLYEQVVGGKW